VDAERVTFTRYRAPRALTPAEAGLLRGVRDGVTVGEIASRWEAAGGRAADAVGAVRALERDRVLVLSLADTAREPVHAATAADAVPLSGAT
jgi:hypothetical protein